MHNISAAPADTRWDYMIEKLISCFQSIIQLNLNFGLIKQVLLITTVHVNPLTIKYILYFQYIVFIYFFYNLNSDGKTTRL